jgi:hypothetical protein
MRDDPGTIAFAIVFTGVLMLFAECAPALAAEAKSRKKAEPALDVSALEKRVADSKHVFVGEGVRIYFVDRRYRETPYVRAEGSGAVKSAVVVVKVTKLLHPAGAENPGHVLVPLETSRDVFGSGNSPYDREVERLVGKPGIWFGEIVTRKDADDGRPFEDPVTLLQAGDVRSRPAATPLPIRYLKEVNDSIVRRGGSQ